VDECDGGDDEQRRAGSRARESSSYKSVATWHGDLTGNGYAAALTKERRFERDVPRHPLL